MDKVRNCLIEGINQNDFISKKQKANKLSINYFGYSIILVFSTFSFVLISSFDSVVGIPIDMAKDELNVIEVFSKALIDLCITHNKFALVNSVRREYNDMKEAIRNSKTSVVYWKFQSVYKNNVDILFEV